MAFRRGFGHADLTNAAAALYDLLATFKRSPDRRSPARWVRVSQARAPHTRAHRGEGRLATPPDAQGQPRPRACPLATPAAVWGPLRAPKALPGGLRGQSCFHNNTKTSAFSLSFPHKCPVALPRDHMTRDVAASLMNKLIRESSCLPIKSDVKKISKSENDVTRLIVFENVLFSLLFIVIYNGFYYF